MVAPAFHSVLVPVFLPPSICLLLLNSYLQAIQCVHKMWCALETFLLTFKWMILVIFYIWEEARVWAQWKLTFDIHLNYPGTVSCFFPSMRNSPQGTYSQEWLPWRHLMAWMVGTFTVCWHGRWHSLFIEMAHNNIFFNRVHWPNWLLTRKMLHKWWIPLVIRFQRLGHSWGFLAQRHTHSLPLITSPYCEVTRETMEMPVW